jgi:hypothetical protein
MFIRRPEDEAHDEAAAQAYAQDQFAGDDDGGDDGQSHDDDQDQDEDQPLLEQTSSDTGESSLAVHVGGGDGDGGGNVGGQSGRNHPAPAQAPAHAANTTASSGGGLRRASSDKSILRKRNYVLDGRGRASPSFLTDDGDDDNDDDDGGGDANAGASSLRSAGSAPHDIGRMKRRVSFTGDGTEDDDGPLRNASQHSAASDLTDMTPPPPGAGMGIGMVGRSRSDRSLPGQRSGNNSTRSLPVQRSANNSTRSLMSTASASSAGSKMIKGRGSIGFVVAADSSAAGSEDDHDYGNSDDDDDRSGTADSGNMYKNDFFANDTTCVASADAGGGSSRSKSSRASSASGRWRSAMSTSSVRTIISGLPLFQGVDDQALDAIVAAFEKVEYDSGDEIIRQGDPCQDADATYMYVVTKGECAVKVNGKVLPDPYGTLTRDAIFGELAIMNDSPRKATITAKTNCSLQRVSKATVKKHLPQDPELKKAFEKERDELKQIDDILDKIAGVDSRYGGDIIHKFKPQRLWLWTRWRYTVLAFSYPFVLFNVALTGIIALVVELSPGSDWTPGHEPDQENPIIMQLNTIFGQVFNYLMTLATFVLTFYLSEAFGLWKQMYFTTRKIQAGLNEIMMMLAVSATRDDMKEFTAEAEACLDDVAHFVRLYHLFMWGKFSDTYRVVISENGMNRMLTRGLITNDQFRCLQVQDDGISAHHTCMEWIAMRIFQGMEEGGIKDDTALKMEILNRINFVRSSQSDVGDIIDGRMSLAYAHLVQMLVDVLLITSPFALYAQQGIWAMLTVGVLTVFYAGVLDLSKMYLDPLDNDGLYDDSVNMDLGVLMNEMNLGAAEWKKGAMFVPF